VRTWLLVARGPGSVGKSVVRATVVRTRVAMRVVATIAVAESFFARFVRRQRLQRKAEVRLLG
jgi:hypothetical protein